MEPNGPGRVHLVPFVHSLSYILIRVHLVPYYHLSGDPLELPQVPLGVPGPHFENQCSRCSAEGRGGEVDDKGVQAGIQCASEESDLTPLDAFPLCKSYSVNPAFLHSAFLMKM